MRELRSGDDTGKRSIGLLRIERPDYRRSKEAELLVGLRSRDPLALAEAYHRTSSAAHACARRLLGSSRDAEALLHAVYTQLWTAPPETARLEGWIRSRCFRLGSDHLRERDEAPASPSLALLLPDLPTPKGLTRDPAEDVLAALPEDDRRAVLLAHDQGLPAAAQDGPDPAGALDRALMALAGPGEGADEGSAQACADLAGMADWTLGLLEADRAARVASEVVDRRACASRSRALRRGRRRLEGLPAAPDLGQRVLAGVLGAGVEATGTTGPGTPPPAEPSPDPGASSAAPPTGQPPPRSQQPLSSLGEAPSAPIPVAPLPSALDDDPDPPHPTDLEMPRDTAPADTDTAPADPARKDTDRAVTGRPGTDDVPETADDAAAEAGAAEGAGRLGSSAPDDDTRDHTEDLTPLQRTLQTGTRPDDAGEAGAAEAQADPTQGLAQADERETDAEEGHAPTTGDEPDEPDEPESRRSFVRPLLNALAILVVLAAGAGLGLLIGFLLVGR